MSSTINDLEGSLISLTLKIARDCPHTAVETNGVISLGSHTLSAPAFKTCYSCGKEGHVRTTGVLGILLFD